MKKKRGKERNVIFISNGSIHNLLLIPKERENGIGRFQYIQAHHALCR